MTGTDSPKRIIVAFAVLAAVCASIADAGRTSVRGYFRKDGTYVRPYTRSTPSSSYATSSYATPTLKTTTSTARMRTTTNLDLRAAANTTARVLAVVKAGTTLTVSNCAGEWCRTTFAGQTGFISREYLAAIATTAASTAPAQPASSSVHYANCTAARAAGVTPIYVGQPGYRTALDRDRDGIACE